MIGIPCVLYVDESKPEAIAHLLETMDKNPIKVGKWAILPNFDRKPYEVGSYRTPGGDELYKVKVRLAYIDPAEADPDTKAGDYEFDVRAKNSLEAKELALDRFHTAHPIGDLGAADIMVEVSGRPWVAS